jgi:hypothetical protein
MVSVLGSRLLTFQTVITAPPSSISRFQPPNVSTVGSVGAAMATGVPEAAAPTPMHTAAAVIARLIFMSAGYVGSMNTR